MAHQYQHTEKEVHLLSGPSDLQPVKGKDQDLLQPPDTSEAQRPSTDTMTDKAQLQPIDRE